MTFRSISAAAALCLAALVMFPVAAQTPQNQSPTTPQRPGTPATGGNQSPAAPATPAEPPATPGVPVYISPGVVQLVQKKLVSLGFPVPSVSGAWGEMSSAALAKFQAKNGLDAGGDLDELTLGALGIAQVLKGELPPGAEAPVSPQAEATGGGPLYASPRLTRLVQAKLTEAGYATDNLFGIWLAGSETAARNFQKAKGLDITASLDLRLLNALGLASFLLDPKPGKLPTDSVVQILADKAVIFTGAPISIGPAGVKQVQLALQHRGFKEVAADGKWSETASAAVKRFQESQKLEQTGSLNLRTLKALGFANPLGDLDQAGPTPPKPTK
jgi:Putative peptidoglycan binding domain